jgi:hypothetical protein
MNNDERIDLLEEKNKELQNRVDFLEFRLELLAEKTNATGLLFERKINQVQYRKIMDLMDSYRYKIDNNIKVNHSTFEQEIYDILPDNHGDYHLCEALAQAFMEDGRWEEVFPKLYGDMPKYKYYMERREKEEI